MEYKVRLTRHVASHDTETTSSKPRLKIQKIESNRRLNGPLLESSSISNNKKWFSDPLMVM